MFPSVLVWVRQQGAWKLHPYNSIAQNCLLLPFWLKFNKYFEDHAVTPGTKPADILAFTVTSHQIHTLRHTCTHQPLSGIPAGHFLFPFTWQISHYNRKTHNLSPNSSHSAQILHILGSLSNQTKYFWYGPHASQTFYHLYFHHAILHFLLQHTTIQSIAFSKFYVQV